MDNLRPGPLPADVMDEIDVMVDVIDALRQLT